MQLGPETVNPVSSINRAIVWPSPALCASSPILDVKIVALRAPASAVSRSTSVTALGGTRTAT